FESIKFNPVELLNTICGAQKLKAEEKGLTFTLKIDPVLNKRVLFGDPTRLTQILLNLVSNAIKFTRQGNIYVKAFCNEDNRNKVKITFTVKDTGIGIAESNLQSIFEPFTQESITTTRQYGGTGMGLAIVKRLLELQGLQMTVTSQLGVGSVFSFQMEFPLSPEPFVEEAQNQPLQAGNDNLGSMRVL